ncbi:MAG: hypothetical protein JNN07_14715 [Verrucomicrobiales bacterium]|nr:hypothetical protein [Verrucomicrobiales bacterium]
MRTSTLLLSVLLLQAQVATLRLLAQVQVLAPPLESPQDRTVYNPHSLRGLPLSTNQNATIGSDGRAPSLTTQIAAQLTIDPATTNQFVNAAWFGAVAAPTNSAGLVVGNLAANALNIGLPAASDGTVLMLAARVGASFYGERVEFLFGQEVTPPTTDEAGKALAANAAASYWLGEAIIPSDSTNKLYWSPHARKLYAVRPGPVSVVWKKSSPNNVAPAAAGNVGFLLTNGFYYTLWTNSYIVSGSPVKPPRQIYWTEGVFRSTGVPVSIPPSRISGVVVAETDLFPRTVPSSAIYQPLGGNSAVDGAALETRTLYLDTSGGQKSLRAYNIEGRGFLELLGDLRSDNTTYESLGVEIVDVLREPVRHDVTIELGNELTAYPGGAPDDAELLPQALMTAGAAGSFAYQHSISGSDRFRFYANRETVNLNDYLLHWLEEGIEGLRWPSRLVRYHHVWPSSVSEYSAFLRPRVSTEEEAKLTAVQLPLANSPSLDFQDPLDIPRAKLTESFKFYTFLTPAHPAHRSLLRFTSGDTVRFERVFSWLDDSVLSNQLAASVAVNLDNWNTNSKTLVWNNNLDLPLGATDTVGGGQMGGGGPRVVTNLNAVVGERLHPPANEVEELAGYIKVERGDSFHPGAYVDPLVNGFTLASQGAIIPVNAIPARNTLEVWWFRKQAVDESKGFKPIFWPAVFDRRTIVWPGDATEIVLASNKGSGPLASLQAKGSIYVQNDPMLPGYNPNEEHALMQGGQAWALRDDLNRTNAAGGIYTSHPFVLLDYTESDGRPALRAFKVVRERPDLGLVFRYLVPAGQILQPPMPLPLMAKPLVPAETPGLPPKSFNQEVGPWKITAGTKTAANGVATELWSLTTDLIHGFGTNSTIWLESTDGSQALGFVPTGATLTKINGFVTKDQPRVITSVGSATGAPAGSSRWRYGADLSSLALNDLIAVVSPNTGQSWRGTIKSITPTFVEVEFAIPTIPSAARSGKLVRLSETQAASQLNGWVVITERTPKNFPDYYPQFTFKDRKNNVWIYRGPHLATGGSPEMVMKYYYKTLPGFFFPGENPQPAVGTITPYLRPFDTASQQYSGGAVTGVPVDLGGGNPLGIVYTPVWPTDTPVLQMAETLTLPKRGLPAVRGQRSAEILYQQSQVAANDAQKISAILHDPTRRKIHKLSEPDATSGLTGIPESIRTQSSRGKTYFPNLPPHLVKRFYFDPNEEGNGALVFEGEFVDAPLGERYLFLNVMGRQDLDAIQQLCLQGDPREDAWRTAVDRVSFDLEKFVHNDAKPGTFKPEKLRSISATAMAQITDDDIAVDSYALTAVGAGVGYVSLLFGNGLNPERTPQEEPVSVQVLRVVDTLYPGEVNVVESANPLSESVTAAQVVDLAGEIDRYAFEWRIAAPVDGFPPPVYAKVATNLMAPDSWIHIPFPLVSETPTDSLAIGPERSSQDYANTGDAPALAVVQGIPFTAKDNELDELQFEVSGSTRLVAGNELSLRTAEVTTVFGTVTRVTGSGGTRNVFVQLEEDPPVSLEASQVLQLSERVASGRPQSVLWRTVDIPANVIYSQYLVSLDLEGSLGAKVYFDGQLAVTANTGISDSPAIAIPQSLDGTALPRLYRISASALAGGTPLGTLRRHTVVVELYSAANPDVAQVFNIRLHAFQAQDITGDQWLALDSRKHEDGVRAVMGGSADVQVLSDNYLIMRYKTKDPTHASFNLGWSQWTEPMLVEGWIKRVLKGINPFNQRVTDLFNNQVNTDVSIISQAGPRWEGDVALSLDNLNQAGLIEIYETVLNRGKMLSIDSGINYGPANDALLLAAGYLNDLYMLLGNEAWADAANPTIGIGTKDRTYGDIATALFSFKGQQASLLDEELALLRGRDDFPLPGVELRPVYNRLVWNYTRGIDAGEVVYALNYNILDQNADGVVNADDARKLYPQGHGDAYGHYLTALTGYYALLMDNDFDWVPRIEAVTVLGKPVSVDYQDERKFAAAAVALARTGRQVFDLTWRQDYKSGPGNGWDHFHPIRTNERRSNPPEPTARSWGMDHWAFRTGQGTYLHWIVGNSTLPDVDPDPDHEGIQKVDRTTVLELTELASLAAGLQTALDNAEAGMSPLGMPESSVPFDLSPTSIGAAGGTTHFEQVYDRARLTLNNAISAFDDAKDVTRLLRSEQDSLADLQATVARQELAYENSLIEIYGTPYADDIGAGRLYKQGYTGPDLVHYSYVDFPEIQFPELWNHTETREYLIDIQNFPEDFTVRNQLLKDFNFLVKSDDSANYTTNLYIKHVLSDLGPFRKPDAWNGRRLAPGKMQQAISDMIHARARLKQVLYDNYGGKADLDKAIRLFESQTATSLAVLDKEKDNVDRDKTIADLQTVYEFVNQSMDYAANVAQEAKDLLGDATSVMGIVGVDNGGDWGKFAIMTPYVLAQVAKLTAWSAGLLAFGGLQGGIIERRDDTYKATKQILELQVDQGTKDAAYQLFLQMEQIQAALDTINLRLREFDDAERRIRSLEAEGLRILTERESVRKRTAAVIQGFRVRDAAFRIFRNEKLERYKTMFDLASRYSFMAAQAFDYETGLLHTQQGKEFIQRIVRSRALGAMKDGAPVFAGSNTGDPGLSSAMAEMHADWQVLRGRLGFNNPDAYGTTASLRREHFRIDSGTEGQDSWKDVLLRARRANLLDDEDVRRQCMQIGSRDGLPVPGIVLEFSTTIADGVNLFGKPLSPRDHAFSPSSFATKIFAMGVALEGYQGMDDPSANGNAVSAAGASSPADPSLSLLDPTALSATPYVYLIPVGVDSMRSPPLGDVSVVRTWSINDVSIPLPFNIGASDFSTKSFWTSSDSLTEPLFDVRKHQAFRPVSSANLFGSVLVYTGAGQLGRSQYTNSRLIGRSAWNSKWKLVIPGRTLLQDPNEGLDRLTQSLKDVKLFFHTYSYSGN